MHTAIMQRQRAFIDILAVTTVTSETGLAGTDVGADDIPAHTMGRIAGAPTIITVAFINIVAIPKAVSSIATVAFTLE